MVSVVRASMTEPVITEGERNQAVWQKLKTYLEAELAVLRARNDKPMTDDATARLRGRIAAVKDVLSLGTEKPQALSEDALFPD